MVFNCSTRWLKSDIMYHSSTIVLLFGNYTRRYATGLQIKMHTYVMNFVVLDEIYLI